MNRFLSSAVNTISFPRLMAMLFSLYAFYTGSMVFGIVSCITVLAGEIITRVLNIKTIESRLDSSILDIKKENENIVRTLKNMSEMGLQ